MRCLTTLILLCVGLLADVAIGACPADKTCISWRGEGTYTDGKPVPSTNVVTYTLFKGPHGGPYVQLNSWNGSPTQFMNVQVSRAVAPLNCFAVTATTLTPDENTGALSQKTSALSPESCSARLKGPTKVGVDKPTNSGVE